jgi:chromosomal replication initiation ATPase DnaA
MSAGQLIQAADTTDSANQFAVDIKLSSSNRTTATPLDTPNADSTETTRIPNTLTMTFQTYTQSEPNRYPNALAQSWRSDNE